jgi:hypothetical protein
MHAHAMLAEDWIEPTIEWREDGDPAARHDRLRSEGELLGTWPPAPFERTATDCFRVGDAYWIWQPEVGGIQFFANRRSFSAFPWPGGDVHWFRYLIQRSWLPAVYYIWGRQVLHASAAARSDGSVVAFSGPSCAGKSTMAYGLARRPGWAAVSDDTLAFSCVDGPRGSDISLHPLRNDTRLRPATAVYYGRSGAVQESLEWPAQSLALGVVYFLEGDSALDSAVRFERLKAAEAYPLLLGQAHALTLKIAEHNHRLMRDYLTLASSVPVYRLTYQKSFDVMGQLLDAVEHHALRVP